MTARRQRYRRGPRRPRGRLAPYGDRFAIDFDGGNDHLLKPTGWELPAEWTCVAWIKPMTKHNGNWLETGDGTNDHRLQVQFNLTGAFAQNAALIIGGILQFSTVSATGTYLPNQWGLQAVYVDEVAGVLKLYADGVEILDETFTPSDLTHGALRIGNFHSGSGPFRGDISRFAFFAGDVTDQLAQWAANPLIEWSSDPRVLNLWRCGDHDGDSTASGGTIQDRRGGADVDSLNMDSSDIVFSAPLP